MVIQYVALLLVASLVFVMLCKYLRIPTIAGYLFLGILVNQHSLGYIEHTDDIFYIAELGVMAIMFTIGLKFSIPKLISLRKNVFGLGGLQVLITLLLVTMISHAAYDVTWHDAILLASVIAMSSTAIISKMLIDRGLVNSPFGTRSIAILIFQDLAVIPLLIYFAFDSSDGGGAFSILKLIVTSIVLLSFLLFIAPLFINYVVSFFANQNSNEIFTIFVLSLIFCISILTYSVGLSLVLGSFITGMLLADTFHKYIVEDIIRPLKELFLGFFFVSIGLLIDPNVFITNWIDILSISILILVFKPLLIYILARLFNTHKWTATKTAVALGGTGEFGFVLITAAALTTDGDFLQLILAVNTSCMLVPPILLGVMETLKNKIAKDDWLLKARDLTKLTSETKDLEDHVIIGGYGQNGRIVSRLLNKFEVPWIAVESNYDIYSKAAEAGLNVKFASLSQTDTLIATGITRAKAIIVTYGEIAETSKSVYAAKSIRKDLPVIVKVIKHSDVPEIKATGADFLSVSSIDTGLSMAIMALREIGGVDVHKVLTDAHDIQKEFGESDTNIFHDVYLDSEDSHEVDRPFRVIISEDSVLFNKPKFWFDELIKSTKLELMHIMRDNNKVELIASDKFTIGDQIFLQGNQFDIDAFNDRLKTT